MYYNWNDLAAEIEKEIKIFWLHGRERISTEELQSICAKKGAPERYTFKNIMKVLIAQNILVADGIAWKINYDEPETSVPAP